MTSPPPPAAEEAPHGPPTGTDTGDLPAGFVAPRLESKTDSTFFLDAAAGAPTGPNRLDGQKSLDYWRDYLRSPPADDAQRWSAAEELVFYPPGGGTHLTARGLA